MRYSVFEYSQEKLVSLGLDVVDALLLNWFANFFCGKMEKKLFKDTEGNTKIYGWVKISKIIEDLPVIGITSEKGIRIRFDNFVEKGILDRETVNTQKGKKSYYRTTSIYDSLINTIPEQNNIQDNNIDDDILQRNCTTFADEKEVQKNENISQRKKTTYAKKNEKENSKNIPQRNCTTFAESNSSTFAQRNCTTFALNNSLINDSLNKDTAAITELTNKYFGENAFDINFTHKAAAFLLEKNIKNYEQYFEFIKNIVIEKYSKIKNPHGFAYTIFFQDDIVTQFFQHQAKQEQLIQKQEQLIQKKQAEQIICPICGDLHNQYQMCPICHNYYFELKNLSDDEIQKKQKIFFLPIEKKENYEKELNNLYQKYPIALAIKNKKILYELKEKIQELDYKYHIQEVS